MCTSGAGNLFLSTMWWPIEYFGLSLNKVFYAHHSTVNNCSPIGWSDFHFICDSRKWAKCYDWLYFYELSSKKSANFASCGRGKIFIFKKSQGPWKWIFFFESWHEPSFYTKVRSPKRKFEIKVASAVMRQIRYTAGHGGINGSAQSPTP